MRRRQFLQALALAGGSMTACRRAVPAITIESRRFAAAQLATLPTGTAPEPLPLPHFPSRLHAFLWRNWQLVPVDRLAAVVGARRADVLDTARRMGLDAPPSITQDQQARSYISVIKRNWHLLPYEQLLSLLDWSPDEMAFNLREDDFLFHKLGDLKPRCEPLIFTSADDTTGEREARIRSFVRARFSRGLPGQQDPLFGFVGELSSRAADAKPEKTLSTSRGFATPTSRSMAIRSSMVRQIPIRMGTSRGRPEAASTVCGCTRCCTGSRPFPGSQNAALAVQSG